MCYKEELQKKNEAVLNKQFDKDNVPAWIRDYFYRIASRAARVNYWSTIRHFIHWLMDNGYIKAAKIEDLKPEDFKPIRSTVIIRYFSGLLGNISKSTLNTKKNILGSFWSYMLNEHYVDDNVIRQAKSNEFKKTKTNVDKVLKMPEDSDIDRMISCIGEISDTTLRLRNQCVVRTLLGTGLRESELAGLDLSDVYLKGGEFRGRHYQEPFITVIGKGHYDYTDDGKDIVYLTKDATEAFNEWISYRSTLLKVVDTDAVFLNRNGKRLKEANIKNIFRVYSKGTISPHMIRHKYAERIITTTSDITFARDQLRHQSFNTTVGIYDVGERSRHILQNM